MSKIVTVIAVIAGLAFAAPASATVYRCGDAADVAGRHTVQYSELDVTIPPGSRLGKPSRPLPGPSVPHPRRAVACGMGLTVAESVSTPNEVNLHVDYHDGVSYRCTERTEEPSLLPNPWEYFVCVSRKPYASRVTFASRVGY